MSSSVRSRTLLVRLGLAHALVAGCEVPRPDGAFLPEPPEEAGAAPDTDFGDAGADYVPPSDAGDPFGGFDTGVVAPDAGTGGPGTDPALLRLTALAGRYLMRMDMFSTGVIEAGVTSTLPTRVSYLYLTELQVRGDQLVAVERLCHETFAHSCTPSCSMNTKEVVSSAQRLWSTRITRTYTLSGTTLAGRRATYTIGYDGAPEDDAPGSVADARVWDVVAGGDREGFQVYGEFQTRAVVVPVTANCTAKTSQRLVTAFGGKLAGTDSAPQLYGSSLRFELDATDTRTGDLGSTGSKDCPAAGGVSTPDFTKAYVRFAPATDGRVPQGDAFFSGACPTDTTLWDVAALTPDAP
jgi:hypothetical protein